jgi:hypothetical protein
MRTSGADTDTALVMVPITVMIVLAVIWMGGPENLFRAVNATVLDGVARLTSLW